jgi:hypothetical protein
MVFSCFIWYKIYMNKGEKAEEAFLEVFRQRHAEGHTGTYAFDLLLEAQEIPTEPTRLHKVGNALLQLAGREARPYRPHYSGQLYPTLARLERQGVVESEWEAEPSTPSGHKRRLYRLADSA